MRIKSCLFLFGLIMLNVVISGCVSSSDTISASERFSPKTDAFNSFPAFLKTYMQHDHISFLNNASTSQKKKQAKFAVMGDIYMALANDNGVKRICEIGLNSDLDPQLSFTNNVSTCNDVECGIAEGIKANRGAINLYKNNIDACTSGVDYPNKTMVKTELENYFNYVEKVLQYIESN